MQGHKKAIDRKQEARLVKLAKTCTATALATRFECSRQSIHKILRKHKVKSYVEPGFEIR
jgi:DNA invertase Pin-like site-specific DNA recombinase